MAEPFLGEIRLTAFERLPYNWHYCDGTLLTINEYQALYSLLGTRFGGNGVTNFALPDLRGRVPRGAGDGPGLSSAKLGESGGHETQALELKHLPAHTHAASFTPQGAPTPLQIAVDVPVANTSVNNVADPTGNIPAVPKPSGAGSINAYQPVSAATGSLGGVNVQVTGAITVGTVNVSSTGNNFPLATMPPYLVVSYIIAIRGIYPSQA